MTRISAAAYPIRPKRKTSNMDQLQNYIAGNAQAPLSGEYTEIIDPATGEAYVKAPLSGKDDVDAACDQHPDGGRLEAVTLRLFDPAAGTWTIYWASSRLPGKLDVPVVGRFIGAHGRFETDDLIDGIPTVVRYEWWHDDPGAPRWQQSFSQDGGATWRPNWQMLLSRSHGAGEVDGAVG